VLLKGWFAVTEVDDVKGVVVKGSGHWLMEEASEQVFPELLQLLNWAATASMPGPRAARLFYAGPRAIECRLQSSSAGSTSRSSA
jgi:hypothetical protein